MLCGLDLMYGGCVIMMLMTVEMSVCSVAWKSTNACGQERLKITKRFSCFPTNCLNPVRPTVVTDAPNVLSYQEAT